jgi:transglutaminase-like putative cysteine protease
VSAVWRPVVRADVDDRLDELARPLFAVEASGRSRAAALADLVDGAFRPDPGPIPGLWLDDVLAARRGHPVLIAAVAAELGRRAGWETRVCSSRTAWYAGLLDTDRLWLIDTAGDGGSTPATVRRHCAHELAFVVLTGLAERFRSPREAARARALRDRLGVVSSPDPPGRALLGALWSGHGTPE